MSIRGFNPSSRETEREKFQRAKEQQEADHQMKFVHLESQRRNAENVRYQALSSQQRSAFSSGEKSTSIADRVTYKDAKGISPSSPAQAVGKETPARPDSGPLKELVQKLTDKETKAGPSRIESLVKETPARSDARPLKEASERCASLAERVTHKGAEGTSSASPIGGLGKGTAIGSDARPLKEASERCASLVERVTHKGAEGTSSASPIGGLGKGTAIGPDARPLKEASERCASLAERVTHKGAEGTSSSSSIGSLGKGTAIGSDSGPLKEASERCASLAESMIHQEAERTLSHSAVGGLNKKVPAHSDSEPFKDVLLKATHQETKKVSSRLEGLNKPAPVRSDFEVLKDFTQRLANQRAKKVSSAALFESFNRQTPITPLIFQFQEKGGISRQYAQLLLGTQSQMNRIDRASTSKSLQNDQVVTESTQSIDTSVSKAAMSSPEPEIQSRNSQEKTQQEINREALEKYPRTDFSLRGLWDGWCRRHMGAEPAKLWGGFVEVAKEEKSQQEINREALEKYPRTDFSLEGLSDGWSRRQMGAQPVTKLGGGFVEVAKAVPTVLAFGSMIPGVVIPVPIVLGSAFFASKLFCDEKEYVKAACVATTLLPTVGSTMQAVKDSKGVLKPLGDCAWLVIVRTSPIVVGAYTFGDGLAQEKVDMFSVADGVHTIRQQIFVVLPRPPLI